MQLYDEVGITSTAHQWFCSYLTDRTQHVKVTHFLKNRSLTCRVPQGSVFCPILFSLYTTELGRIIEKYDACRKLFADDTGWYYAFHPYPTSAVLVVEGCCRHVKAWMTTNKLKLNDEKTTTTEAIVCGFKVSQFKVSVDSIHIGQSVISFTDTVRDLGVFLDKNLLMTNHMSSAVRSCFFNLRCLGKHRQ